MTLPPVFFALSMVIAAVSVVLPWSTWPMVPTLIWGLFLSNFSLAITPSLGFATNPWSVTSATFFATQLRRIVCELFCEWKGGPDYSGNASMTIYESRLCYRDHLVIPWHVS